MSRIKTFSTDGSNGDMFYIKHNSSNFTIIDCCIKDENKKNILNEIKEQSKDKTFIRFISTHPDEDHIQNLNYLDDTISIPNFYCVKNKAIKIDTETEGFKRYKKLRDSDKAFFLFKGCSRKWMNESGKDKNGIEYSSAGISILWPDTNNSDFKDELVKANKGEAFNNISCIIKYSVQDGVTAIWMGDLENCFMEKICDKVTLPKTNILFAPHHGRKTGKIPDKWIKQLDPDIIIMGEANSKDSDYSSYINYNILRQNSAKNIRFECEDNQINIFSTNPNYTVNFLKDDNIISYEDDYYIGSIHL